MDTSKKRKTNTKILFTLFLSGSIDFHKMYTSRVSWSSNVVLIANLLFV